MNNRNTYTFPEILKLFNMCKDNIRKELARTGLGVDVDDFLVKILEYKHESSLLVNNSGELRAFVKMTKEDIENRDYSCYKDVSSYGDYFVNGDSRMALRIRLREFHNFLYERFLSEMPLLINDPVYHTLAKWRIKIGK